LVRAHAPCEHDLAMSDAQYEAAEACLEGGEPSDARVALRILQECLRSDPQDRTAMRMVARAFDRLGQHERARIVRREIEAVERDLGPHVVVVAPPVAHAERTEKQGAVHVVEVSPDSWSAIAALQTDGPADDRVVAFVCVDGEGRNTARTIYGVVKSFFS
jgi:hypothetical protein